MRNVPGQSIRTVVLLGHSGAGKTMLADAMVFLAGHTNRLGKTSEGTSVFDYEPDEVARQGSISMSVGFAEWNQNRIQLIDTPGFADFFGEVCSGVRVADAAVMVVSAVDGIGVQTEKGWAKAQEFELPALAIVSRMDGDRAKFESTVEQIGRAFSANAVPLAIPIGAAGEFQGVIDVLNMKAFGADSPGKMEEIAIPDALKSAADAASERLIEAAAEGNDELTEKYLEELTLAPEEIRQGLAEAIRARKVVPVLCAAAEKRIGVSLLMNAIIDFLPSPLECKTVTGSKPGSDEQVALEKSENAPFSTLVFKTVVDQYGRVSFFRIYSGTVQGDSQVYNPNVGQRERMGGLFLIQGKEHLPIARAAAGEIAGTVKLEATNTAHTLCQESHPILLTPPTFPTACASVAVHPKSRADEDKLATGLRRLVEEDSSLQWYRDAETNETILAGLGDVHLQAGIDRLKRKFGVELTTTTPKIPYKESIKKKADAEGRHKKQTGGAGQFGVATIEVSALPRGSGIEFQNAIVGGVIPGQFVPSVEKGVRERLARGFVAGYPMLDVHVKLYDGKTHPVDSNAISFQLAGRLAVEGAIPKADPFLLEPIMDIEVIVPEENMGDIIGDLNAKRGRIMGMESRGNYQVVRAQAPLRDLSRYSADLRSITRGRGSFTMSLSHYEEVPAHLSQQIVAEAKQRKEEED